MSTPEAGLRRPAARPLRVLLVVALVAAAAVCLYWRSAYGQWFPGPTPPRLVVCGRTYDRADAITLAHPPTSDVRTQVGAYPPIVGVPVKAGAGCGATVPTGVYLKEGDGYVGYGLSGGP